MMADPLQWDHILYGLGTSLPKEGDIQLSRDLLGILSIILVTILI